MPRTTPKAELVAGIDINGTTIYYERTGGGPAVLFVHGMCGDADVWADQARRLCDRYTCVRYDRRGHSAPILPGPRHRQGRHGRSGRRRLLLVPEQPDAFANAVSVFAGELDRRSAITVG